MAGGAHPSIVPFQTFAASDGHIAVGCAKEIFFRRLCVAIERDDLLKDERYRDFAGRDRHRSILIPDLARTFAERPGEEWVRRLQAASVPVGTVNDVEHALKDPQIAARDGLLDVEHPRFGTVHQVASPLRFDGGPPPLRRGPGRGEHSHEILSSLCGYTARDIELLTIEGAFGDVAVTPDTTDADRA